MLRGKRARYGRRKRIWAGAGRLAGPRRGQHRLLRPAPGGYPGNQHSDRGGGRDGAGYLCDLAQPASIAQFSAQLLQSETPVDILILNAAQWLSGNLDDRSPPEIVDTLHSG
jgi:NAD(P)-dependent dehydrogenase (short-subunit alcohol dehydrogenase family)